MAHADGVASTITALLSVRRGHFRMESGFHSGSWFELGSLFYRPEELRPFVSDLAKRLSSHRIEAVCGPMTGGAKLAELIAVELDIACFVAERIAGTEATGMFPVKYRVAAAQRQDVGGRAVAIVDDAISAGSAVRGTHEDLIACGARPVALGALVVFGDAATHFAAENGIALEAIEGMPFDMWVPSDCPLCRAGVAVDSVADTG